MTHKERAIITLQGGQADFVPTCELVFHETERDFEGRIFQGTDFAPLDSLNKNIEDIYDENAQLYVDVARKYNHSIIYIVPLQWTYAGYYHQAIEIMKRVKAISGDEFCIMLPGDPTFKIPGDPMQFSIDMYDNPDKIKGIAEQKLSAMIKTYDAAAEAGADGIVMTSDYAMNSGPFLSPDMFREFVFPYLKRAIDEIHKRDLLVIKHTDGNLMPIIDQLVEAGPDAIHSLDPMAGMDIKEIKEKYGKDLCLCGNVQCDLLQNGTDDEIKASAEYAMKHGKPGGGYIYATSNCVFRGMPIKSYDIMHSVWDKNREY